jgi:hypothetical protein
MSSKSVCRVACSWVDVGSFQTRLAVRFMILTASVRNILDTSSYVHMSYFEVHVNRMKSALKVYQNTGKMSSVPSSEARFSVHHFYETLYCPTEFCGDHL